MKPPAAPFFTPHSRALEHLTIERDTLHFKQQVALKYADLVYYGQWFHPLRESLDVFINKVQEAPPAP